MTPLSNALRNGMFKLLRFGFRLLPMREGTRDRLRNRFLDRYAHLLPASPQGQPAEDGIRERRARIRAGQPAIGHVPYRTAPLPDDIPAKLIAFYLPQFHRIAENDAWWGKGFTEWRNVTRALPQFEGHAQPRLPGDLGFYDLGNAQVMHEQARLAREYGIAAFCFYFYWFSGRTLLETPLRNWLADPSLDMPLCLCWANEKWARRWDGRGDDILIDQRHSAEDDLAFIGHVAQYMRDPRYLHIEGKPMLLVYRPGLLPDIQATASRWRHWCRENGIGEIHLAYVQGFERPTPADIGFDAAVEFPPNMHAPASIATRQRLLNPEYRGEVLDWRELADNIRLRPLPSYRLYPGVNPGWDNEPRRPGNGRTYLHASPRGYRDWLRDTIHHRLANTPISERLVFINAWNEWAEGAVLEPDAQLGHAWLEATRQALAPHAADSKRPSACAVIHAWHLDAFDEILEALRLSALPWRLVVTTSAERAAAVRARLESIGLAWELEVMENRGRDILPFLNVANRLLDEGVEVVLKLHTKRSTHRQDGDRWRKELIDRLVGRDRAQRILEAYATDPTLGIVAPEGHTPLLRFYWGANKNTVGYLASRLGISPPRMDSDRFVSGSMFWLRLEALRPVLDAHLAPDEFESEQGQIDGTFAHALERVFALSAKHAGFQVITAASATGEPDPDPDAPYLYASHR